MGSEPGKRIALFGATGVAGGGVLRACLGAPEVAQVVAITRRPLQLDHPKLREVLCSDFADPNALAPALAGVDACLYCLGISVSQVSSEAEYRRITHDFALAAGRALAATSPGAASPGAASPGAVFHFLSGQGTSATSRMMWARVKGETEQALGALRQETPGLAGLVCWRPGMILAHRAPRGLPWAYRAAYPIARLLRFFPALSVEAETIGLAMLQIVLEGQKAGTLGNLAIRAAARRYLTRSHDEAFSNLPQTE